MLCWRRVEIPLYLVMIRRWENKLRFSMTMITTCISELSRITSYSKATGNTDAEMGFCLLQKEYQSFFEL